MTSAKSFRRWFFSPGSVRSASLPDHLSTSMRALPEVLSEQATRDLVVSLASELLAADNDLLPRWVGTDSTFLILMDLPEPAALRLPSLLGVRKPDQRMHITRDVDAIKRLLIALHRPEAWESIVDAYVLLEHLVVVCGDLSVRDFPKVRLPRVSQLSRKKFAEFEVDTSGSFLYWPGIDVHLGPSQMLQPVDPMYLADMEIHRYAMEKVSLALLEMREASGLTQGEIPGLSERQVRRLENEESRLTVDAARKYAAVFQQDLSGFLKALSLIISRLRDRPLADDGAESASDSSGKVDVA